MNMDSVGDQGAEHGEKEDPMRKTAGLLADSPTRIKSLPPFASLHRIIPLVLLFVAILTSASSASAAITADSSSSFLTNRSTRTITWSHTLGSGNDRALVVAVATNDLIAIKSDIATVRFNNVMMHVAPNSHATAPGPRVLETQFFYLTGDELPAPGTYDVVVQFTRDIGMAAGGSVSLFGVLSGPPVASATNVKPSSPPQS